MPNLYVTTAQLKAAGIGDDAASADTVWDLLAEAVSRLFDRECEVADGFFNAAPGSGVTLKSYTGNGTKFLKVFPYIGATITIVDINGTDYFEALAADRQYAERDGYLVFNFEISKDTPIDVTARYGFAAIPADIQQACIEQALAMWRKKDMSFADISGVSAAAVNAELSPTFSAVAKRYREIYSSNTIV